MALPPIPFIQESKEEIIEKHQSSSAPPQQQNLDLSGRAQEANANFWSEANDFTREHEHIRALLEGKTMVLRDDRYIFDYPTNEKGMKIKEPFCTPQGQSWILQTVAPMLQKGTTLTNMSIEACLDRCHTTSRTLIRQLYINADEWEIDPNKIESLVETIMDRVEMARRRSVNNEERGFIGKAITILTNLTGSTTQGKPGLLPPDRKGL